MRRILATSLVLVCTTMTAAEAADTRDSPVLADFSEGEVIVEPKAPKESILPVVETALAGVCGRDGTATNIQTYKGSFTAANERQEIHYAKCGEKMFGAKHAYAITYAGEVVGSGESWKGKGVRAVDDLDDNDIDEVLLQYTITGIIKVHARFVSYASGAESVVQDFGLVFTASDDTSPDVCRERAAVIFMSTYDPTKMNRKDYGQPCGAAKEWAEIGATDLMGPG
ncbi:MAG: hypothetical protein JRJ84_14505 [Deltaproteobacteria bacterium]|nr:hypothetical protein [Deltaproteobacteria bacterium]